MSKLFYDHLINLESIHDQLDQYDLSNTEKAELMKTIDETIHHEVMNTILTHLPDEHHEEFLENFTAEPHADTLIVYIQEKTPEDVDMEKEIGRVEQNILLEMLTQEN